MEITHTVTNSSNPTIFKVIIKTENPTRVTSTNVNACPFGNCQIFCVSSVGHGILYARSLEESIKIFKYIYGIVRKNVIQIDVLNQHKYHERILEVFGKENIMSRADYNNLTNSKMTSYILNTKNIQ